MRRYAFNSKMHLNNMVYRILNEKMYKSAIFSKNHEIRLVLGIFLCHNAVFKSRFNTLIRGIKLLSIVQHEK